MHVLVMRIQYQFIILAIDVDFNLVVYNYSWDNLQCLYVQTALKYK